MWSSKPFQLNSSCILDPRDKRPAHKGEQNEWIRAQRLFATVWSMAGIRSIFGNACACKLLGGTFCMVAHAHSWACALIRTRTQQLARCVPAATCVDSLCSQQKYSQQKWSRVYTCIHIYINIYTLYVYYKWENPIISYEPVGEGKCVCFAGGAQQTRVEMKMFQQHPFRRWQSWGLYT